MSDALYERCKNLLEKEWKQLISCLEAMDERDCESRLGLGAEDAFTRRLRRALRSRIKSYHYVPLTQILAKTVEPRLDSHALQKAYGERGFDARTIAHKVVVPFEKRFLENALGGSPEPYVNNPLRVPGVTSEFTQAQKYPEEWENLIALLDEVERRGMDPQALRRILQQTLLEVYRLARERQISYPIPHRLSLEQTEQLLQHFLAAASGGERLEVLTTALLRTLGRRSHLFNRVERAKVNAADRATGLGGDIECYLDDELLLLVEVKDKQILSIEVNHTIEKARLRKVQEVLFVFRSEKQITPEARQRASSEFAQGMNLYLVPFATFAQGLFILLGEQGRHEFLEEVGKELDRTGSFTSRKAWQTALREITT